MEVSPTQFRHYIDEYRVDGRAGSPPLAATVGERIWLFGWAATTSGAPAKVTVRINETAVFSRSTPVGRPDVAEFLKAPRADLGFRLQIDTRLLLPGNYEARVVLENEAGNHAEVSSFSLALAPRPKALPGHRILIAGAPKSGSRHVQSVLRRYYGIVSPPLPHTHDGEHVLTPEMMEEVGDAPFVWHYHPMARDTTVQTLKQHGAHAVVTWRNLADTVVSIDDHIRNSDGETWRHTYMYIDEREAYCALDPQARYQFIIRNGLPWYIMFYLSWRKAGMPLFASYETMVRDPMACFRPIIAQLDGRVDEARLAAIVGEGARPESGLNVGVIGRSADLLSAETKELLETLVRSHPSGLDELYRELPWVTPSVPIGV